MFYTFDPSNPTNYYFCTAGFAGAGYFGTKTLLSSSDSLPAHSENEVTSRRYAATVFADDAVSDAANSSMCHDTLLTVPADRKSTRLNSSHIPLSRMPSSA